MAIHGRLRSKKRIAVKLLLNCW